MENVKDETIVVTAGERKVRMLGDEVGGKTKLPR
jgi:hypothetical protein